MALFLISVALVMGKLKDIEHSTQKPSSLSVYLVLPALYPGSFTFMLSKTGPVSGVIAIDKLSIVLAILLAALFLGESLTWKTAIGAILITGGAFLVAIK
jgi:transporter family protein